MFSSVLFVGQRVGDVTISGSELLSLLDGFSIYNQVLVAEEDRVKTTFKTKWGNFAYKRMPFGLINVGATF